MPDILLVDNVVSPTVPETPDHPPQPRVYRGSDADHIMPSVVRRQAIGSFRADTGQAVRMGLAAANQSGCTALAFAFCPCAGGLGILHGLRC